RLNAPLAVLKPLLDRRGAIVTRAESAGDRRSRQGRPACIPVASAQTVDDSAVIVGAFLEIGDGLVDRLLGNRDAGVASSAKRLELGNGHGTLIGAVALEV